jgi:hypothetical protein
MIFARTLRPTAIAAMALALAGCALHQTGGSAVATSPNGVITKTELNGRYLAVIGPRQQHAQPFFGIADTNYYTLRSLIDRTSGQTSHQLLVEDSYVGPERRWDAAHDGWGQTLRFIPISHNELACEGGGCSYAEEFAAAIPEPELRGSPRGMEVTFTDKAGDKKTIAVPGNVIAVQIAAFDSARASPGAVPMPAAAGSGTGGMPPPSAFSSPAPAAPTGSRMPPPSAFSSTAPTAPAGSGMPPPSAFSSAPRPPPVAPTAYTLNPSPPPAFPAGGAPSPGESPAPVISTPPSAALVPPSRYSPTSPQAAGQQRAAAGWRVHPQHAKRDKPATSAQELRGPAPPPATAAPPRAAAAPPPVTRYEPVSSSLPQPVPTEPIAQPGVTAGGAPLGAAMPSRLAPPAPPPTAEQ